MSDSVDQPPNLGRPDPVPQVNPRPEVPPNMPSQIAGFRIQRVLGSGGMATVYAALQQQPRRTVALKVMKAGLADSSGRADSAHRRFKREIEILGKLHHPCIAQIYEAGVYEEGGERGVVVPYFVMEYVSNARNILEHTAALELSQRERLKLFVKVCAAVEHGHRNKVIHRDLKPSNILIDQYGEPKVIDFGVAQAADLDLANQTMHADAGRLVGTLKYMAPEQLESKPIDLDPRCDVYALGVLLYKLLTGKHPHELEGLSLYEAVRVIREQTPPPPGRVSPSVRGDLETIILKAMSPDRAQRYTDAGSLGRDIVRYLSDKPVRARRASLLHRARLLMRRRRAAFTAGAIITVILAIGGSIVAVERLSRHEQQRQAASDRQALQEAQESLRRHQAALGTPPLRPPSPSTLTAHTGRITDLAFSTAGGSARLASASYDHTIVLWDLITQQPVATVREFDGPVTALSFSGDGSLLAAAADAQPMVIVDAIAGKVVRTIRHDSGSIQAIALRPDGGLLAYAGEDLTLRLVPSGDSSRGQDAAADLRATLRSTSGPFTAVGFARDGALLAAGSRGGALAVWRLTQDSAIIERRLQGLDGVCVALAFAHRAQSDAAPDTLIAIDDRGRAMTWRLSSDDVPIEINALSGGRGSARADSSRGTLMAADFSAAAALLAVAVIEEVVIWDLIGSSATPGAAHGGGPVLLGSPIRCEQTPYAVAIDANGQWCAIGHIDGDISLEPVLELGKQRRHGP